MTLDIVNRIIKRRAYLLYIQSTQPGRSISIQQIKGECLSLILSCFSFYTHRILIYHTCIDSIFAISFSRLYFVCKQTNHLDIYFRYSRRDHFPFESSFVLVCFEFSFHLSFNRSVAGSVFCHSFLRARLSMRSHVLLIN